MALQAMVPSLWLATSIAHLVLFYLTPDPSLKQGLWNTFTSVSNYINLLFTAFFLWVGVKRQLFTFLDSCCPAIIFAHLVILLYIWATVGCCCALLLYKDIENAYSLFWATSLFYSAISLSLVILCVVFGMSFICPTILCHNTYRLTYHLLLVGISGVLTAVLASQPGALHGHFFFVSLWSFTVSSLLLLFQILFCKEQSPSYFLNTGGIRLKRVFHAFVHFLTFQGPVDFAFLLAGNPHAFQTHPLLSVLTLTQTSLCTPFFLINFFYSCHLDSKSLFLLQPIRSVLLDHFDQLSDGFFFQTIFSLLYLFSHSADLTHFMTSTSLAAWSSFSMVALFAYFILNYSLKSKIQDQDQITMNFITKIRNLRLLGEGGILVIWMFWAGLWAVLAAQSYSQEESPAFSLGLILLFTLFVKNVFWFYRYHKLVVENFLPQEGELEALTEESDSENDHLNQPLPEQTFSSYLKRVDSGLNSDSDCPICLGKLKTEQPVSGLHQCDHHFHQECITHWLQMKKSCPLDRKPLL